MSNPLQFAQDSLDDALGKLQGEVGRFLILKERISALPVGLRAPLMSMQNALEQEAIATVAKAQNLQAPLKAFDPYNLDSYAKLGGSIQAAVKLAPELKDLAGRIKAHQGHVEAAEKSGAAQEFKYGQAAPTSWVKVALLAGVAFVAAKAWKVRRG